MEGFFECYSVVHGFGKKKIGEIKYFDVLQFYHDLLEKRGLQINTIDTIHTILHPTFQLAVHDGIIRTNPSDRVMAETTSYYSRRDDTYKCEFRASLPKTEAGIRLLPMMQ